MDRRIAADLRTQKTSILKGLVCVVGASLLTGGTLLLTATALNAISDAAPVRVDFSTLASNERAQAIGRELSIPTERVAEAIQRASRSSESADQATARQDRAIQTLGYCCIGVVLLFGLKYLLTRGHIYYLSRASSRLGSDLRMRLFTKLMRLPVSYFNAKRTGEIQSIVTNDVGVYQSAVQIVKDSIEGPIKAVVALGMVFFLQWRLGLIAIALLPFVAFYVSRMGRKIKESQSAIQEDLANVTALSQEALAGVRVVKAFSAEARLEGMLGKAVERQYVAQLTGAKRLASLRPMVELIGALSIAMVLYICGFLSRMDMLRLADIIVVVQALDQVNQGLRALSNLTSTYNQVQAAVDRIHALVLDQPDEEADTIGSAVIQAPTGRIEFESVSFDYPDGSKAIRDVSFVLEPGQSLALVGPSGAGKSTIADLALRFYDPTSGRITFDGQDYRELNVKWLRNQFAVVPQQTFLFAGTVEDNLRLGRPDAPEQDLQEALRLSNADGFVGDTGTGLGTVLGERGVRFSGGELQRLSIARAIVADPKVLVLDEATSNLDSHSERVVTDALAKVMNQRTTLFIAHRLSTAARADRVLLLRQGQVVEAGSHEELLALGGAYASMWRAYSEGVLDEPAH